MWVKNECGTLSLSSQGGKNMGPRLVKLFPLSSLRLLTNNFQEIK